MAKNFTAFVGVNTYYETQEAVKIEFRQGFSSKQRILFFRQLAVMLQSGLPLLRALELLGLRLDKRLRFRCFRLRQLLARGSTLAEAMEREGFPQLAAGLTAAGEAGGQLGTALEQLAQYYEEQEKLHAFVVRTALYPALLLGASACVLLLFLLYVLPVLGGVYAGMGIKPTGMLALLLALQEYMTAAPLLCAAAALAAVVLALCLGRLCLLRLLGSSRSGSFYGLINEVRFCRLMALLLDSGVNITRAVEIAAGAMSGAACVRQLLLLNGRLRRGMDIGTALAGAAGLLSPWTMELLCAGAVSGRLPQMLREAARIGEQELLLKTARFKEVLGPLLLLCAALVIAAVVCAVMGPLLEMLTALPEYS